MSITVTGRKMPVTDALREYAEEKIGHSMRVMDISPLDAEVVLLVEKNPANPRPAVCEVTLRTKGHIVRVEEHEEDMYAAIDVAAAKVVRQLRKYKTKVIDRKIRAGAEKSVQETATPPATDYDQLMAELSHNDEVVRVKEIEFAPLTEEEALINIDLLGHDFFAYTDRDSGLVHVLYRRIDGGYGLLKQTEEVEA
ncbi:MAG: ribosome hibernation-promoting factor, HPF/YfiA family [Raoultibacter sp.]|jgi:putative sigma-54 modulation protein